MIIGSGLIATAFREQAESLEKTCIFASGVANSSNTDEREFLREKTLLTEALATLPPDYQIVYFSTCSVYDEQSINSAYVQHKLKMESLVLQRPGSHVFRLPQLAGISRNGNTLLNYISSNIERGEPMKIWSKAERNIIDVSDVVKAITYFLKHEPEINLIANICNPSRILVLDIVKKLEEIKGKLANIDVVEGGNFYDIPLEKTSNVYTKVGLSFDQHYIPSVLKKYYSNPASTN